MKEFAELLSGLGQLIGGVVALLVTLKSNKKKGEEITFWVAPGKRQGRPCE